LRHRCGYCLVMLWISFFTPAPSRCLRAASSCTVGWVPSEEGLNCDTGLGFAWLGEPTTRTREPPGRQGNELLASNAVSGPAIHPLAGKPAGALSGTHIGSGILT